MYPPEISKNEVNELPLKSFTGKVVIVADPKRLDQVFSELKNYDFVGFDTETRPAFKKGVSYNIALIQLAISKKVFLLRVNKTGIDQKIKSFVESDEIKKIGVSLRDDLHGLRSSGISNPKGFYDLNQITKEMGIASQGLRKLTGLILGFRISKNMQTSNWERNYLSDKQVSYAATDAWCCFKIYEKLLKQGYIDYE